MKKMNNELLMKRMNELVIARDEYKTKEDFENAIKEAIMVLLNNGYIMTVKYDCNDKNLGIAVIHFNYANESIGDSFPYWLYPDEYESIEWENE